MFAFLSATAFSQTDNVAKAKTFIELLEKEDFTTAHSYFNDDLKTNFPQKDFEGLWKTINSQFGKFKRQISIDSDKNPVVIMCEFENTKLGFRISFDSQNKINGFFLCYDDESVPGLAENIH